jgi:hypothetical protein
MDLTKSKYCTGLQCPKILWMDLNMPEKFDASAVDESRLETGIQVGALARGYFGSYAEVPATYEKSKRIEETKRLIDAGANVIAEASFAFNGNFCSVDLLRKTRGGYELIEVKSSSFSPGGAVDDVNPDYFDDMAYQYYVVTNSGLNINKVSIMLLNRNYVRRGDLDLQSLFLLIDCTNTVIETQRDIEGNIADIRELAEQADEPDITIGNACTGCGYNSWCLRKLPANNVFDIGWGMRGNKKNQAYCEGIVSFEDIIKDALKLTEKQARQVETVVENLPPYINKAKIREFLSTVKYPLYHLDFETYQQPIPLWDNVSPYQQIPFQYSLHIQNEPCGVAAHKEFLGREGVDPRRGLAERLTLDIPMGACVMAYSMSFEKTQIKGLANLFPDLSDHLMSIHDNVIDLMIPFHSGAYYCREMGGSCSIKKVLPALCPDDPELDYNSLKHIHHGGEAMAAYAALHEKPADEIAETRAALLAYCRLDTLAMVKILEKLYEACHDCD